MDLIAFNLSPKMVKYYQQIIIFLLRMEKLCPGGIIASSICDFSKTVSSFVYVIKATWDLQVSSKCSKTIILIHAALSTSSLAKRREDVCT